MTTKFLMYDIKFNLTIAFKPCVIKLNLKYVHIVCHVKDIAVG